MVIITEIAERKNSAGESFVALILTSGVEMVRSMQGKFYATVRKASIPSTLSLELAKQMIGQKIKGMILKVPCEPYMYKTQSGEQIQLNWNYQFTDDAESLTEEVLG